MRTINFINYLFLILTSLNFIDSSLKFNIPSYRDKCFHQELYVEGTFLIRYDLSGFEQFFKDKEQQELFNNIKIFIKDEKGKYVYETSLTKRKDKIAIFLKEPQGYSICTRYYRPRKGKELPGSVVMGIKIRHDYSYADLDQTLYKEDVDDFKIKIRDIKRDVLPSIEVAKRELREEDKTAKSIISAINTYYKLCCIQLSIIIAITIYTIVSYQEFFKKKVII